MKIYWDIDNRQLMKSSTNSQPYQQLDFILRDLVDITLYIMTPDPDTGAYTVADPPAGQNPIFGLKDPAHLDQDYLAGLLTWTKTAAGTYSGTVDLRADALTAFVAETEDKEVMAEFTLVDVDSRHHRSTRILAIIDPDVNRGTEGSVALVAALNSIWREELIAGQLVLVARNSLNQEYMRIPPPGA